MRVIMDGAWAVLTIFGESRGEPYEGKLAVANVIRHRMERKYSSDGTVSGTCLRSKQFSCWNDSDRNRILMTRIDDADPIVEECIRAWRESTSRDLVPGAVLYLNKGLVLDIRGELPDWATDQNEVATINRHTFYKDG